MNKKEEVFVDLIRKNPELGPDAAYMVENLIRAQEAFKKLSLKQRLALVSLATQHEMSRINVSAYG